MGKVTRLTADSRRKVNKKTSGCERKSLLGMLPSHLRNAILDVCKPMQLPVLKLMVMMVGNRTQLQKHGIMIEVPQFKTAMEIAVVMCDFISINTDIKDLKARFTLNQKQKRFIIRLDKNSSTLMFEPLQTKYRNATAPIMNPNDVTAILDDFFLQNDGHLNLKLPTFKSHMVKLVQNGIFATKNGNFDYEQLQVLMRMCVDDSSLYRDAYTPEMMTHTINRYLAMRRVRIT